MGETTTPEARRYQAKGTDWGVEHPDTEVIENFVVRGGPQVPYTATLIDAPKIEGVGGANGGRTCVFMERDPKGTGYCGITVLTICRGKGSKGRWHVVIEKELVFLTETENRVITRATRASVVNPDHAKLADTMHIEAGHGWSNARRIGGPPIKVELKVLKTWSPQLAEAGRLMDIALFADETEDLIGAGALLKAIRKLPSEIKVEVLNHLASDPVTP